MMWGMIKNSVSAALASVGIAALVFPPIPAQADSPSSGLAGAYLSVRHAQASADPVAASHFIDEVLKIDPENRSMKFLAYFQKAQAGDIDGARPFAEETYADRPSLAIAPLLIAITDYADGRFAKAENLISNITGRNSIGTLLPLVRAWARAPVQPYVEAASALAPYEGQDELRELSASMMALLNEYYGRDEAALVYYRALAANIDRVPLYMLRLITDGLHRLDKSEEARDTVARYRELRSPSPLWDGYLTQYEDADTPRAPITAQAGMAEALYAMTRIRMATARRASGLQMALVYANLALYLNPDLDLLRREVADVFAASGQPEMANDILQDVQQSDPGYLVARLRLAENLDRLGQTDEAVTVLDDLARIFPGLPEPLVSLGDLLRNRQRFDEAISAYDRAFARYLGGKPDSWAVYYGRGMALERAQLWDRAERDFKQALQINPEQAQVLNYLGYSWLDRGENISEARRMIEIAISQHPEDGFIVDSLGWAQFLMGEYEEAVFNLERAVSLKPADPTINEHLGDAYWKVGRETEARFQWRRALSMDPEQDQAEEIRVKLQRGLARN